jgi:hypothetical protein
MKGGRTSRRALKPAQGLERGRDGGEVKVMMVTRTGPIVEALPEDCNRGDIILTMNRSGSL